MRLPKRIFLLVSLALTACTTVPQTANSAVMHGVEVWTNGVPSRPYTVIDTISGVGPDQSVTFAQEEALLAQEARKRGADAMIVTTKVQVIIRQDPVLGRPLMAPKVIAEIVKYQ
jgi:hypothetical protein